MLTSFLNTTLPNTLHAVQKERLESLIQPKVDKTN